MAPSISQILTVSYPEVESKMAENQWAESALMREFERQGVLDRVSGSPTYDVALDFQANAGGEFNASDLVGVDTAKTEVLSTAQYTSAQLQVPVVWSKKDEAENSSANQKVALVKALIENALATHDDLIEQALFASSTNGFIGLPGLLNETDGTGTVGGINAGTDAFWKNGFSSGSGWNNATDIVAAMTAMYNTVIKGSGSPMQPKFLVADAETQAIYESTQQENIRYVDTREADAGFKVLAFKNARFVFSQYGTDVIYFLNPKNLKLKVVKQAYRLLGDTIEFPDSAGYIRKVFTLCQLTTNNRSRLGALKK